MKLQILQHTTAPKKAKKRAQNHPANFPAIRLRRCCRGPCGLRAGCFAHADADGILSHVWGGGGGGRLTGVGAWGGCPAVDT